ncbi:MAG: sulfur oxidation c-type cytochrome SoxX [Rhodocyclaceae bacterium]|nr:sulfur oxidation c-type cytochrome SoxX [Rhodocyclaceae bacterium]HNQ55989.1 sulfur oxidation c-type cytochrome SoxX [Candidatus Desulfobacillus denitrificans]HNT62013.1 sulfur oxidation c-type cytochrome SoxX [Candidatus Desulfobacillus denitrificans]
MNKILFFLAVSLAGTVALADGDYRAEAIAMMKHDFKTKGIATADRVNEDGVQAVCNRSGDHPPKAIAERLEKDQLESIRYPADGKLMGDWKAGEKLAQSGRGMTWSDKAGVPGGGNCYNCHQIGPAETSFGTVGPSLYQFGKLRGSGPDMQKYVYGRIWNAKAFNLCSAMPRFGHVQALTEAQIKDLVALLLDPQSPVNSK